jgi:amino acid adenylation domain-containing protein
MIPPALHASATPLLHDLLEASAARDPEQVALVCKQVRHTYRELDQQANALAHALQRLGVVRGDRVLVFGDNTVETVVAFWGTLKASAVVTVVNPLTKADKLAWLLNDCRARVLVTDAHLAAVVEEAIPRCLHLEHAVVSGALAPGRLQGARHLVPWAEVSSPPQAAPPARQALELDLAAIVYTSGSTGDPKGVMLTHRNMLSAAASIATYLRLRSDDVILGVLPLAFDYGLYQMILSFRMGARLVLERSFAFPAQVLKVMAEERVTGFPGVPTIFAVLAELKSLAAYDLSSLRFVTNTAAALPVKHIELLGKLFPQARVYSMYGLTECKRCTYLPPEDLARKPTSVGVAIPNTELWLVDEQDRRLGPDQVGQLVIRGPTVMKGYWEKPEATAAKLRPGPLPGEQVLYTGDLCRLDEEGYLYFVGRMDDIIKSRGEKVAPKEVEAALVNVEGVKEAVVFGVPDELLGEAVKAVVVLEAGASWTERELIKECQKRLEGFMVPKYVELVAELPKTTTGKLTRKGLT